MQTMAAFEHLLGFRDVGDMLDEIASAEPPAYLRRCFAEACSVPTLSPSRVPEIAFCAMVLDAILNGRAYEMLEPELIADWREHHVHACRAQRDLAVAALQRARGVIGADQPDAAAELEELTRRLTA
jgi:hypothetical protein